MNNLLPNRMCKNGVTSHNAIVEIIYISLKINFNCVYFENKMICFQSNQRKTYFEKYVAFSDNIMKTDEIST